MALSDFRAERVEVKFKGGSFTVRGLSFDAFAALINTHLPDLDKVADMFKDHRTNVVTDAAFKRALLQITTDAPVLAANVIALASGEDDVAEQAGQLPLPVQLEALKQIARLTFEEAGGVKKFLGSLAEMFGPVAAQTTNIRASANLAMRKKPRSS